MSEQFINRDSFIDRLKDIASEDWNKKAFPYSWSYAYEQFIDDVEMFPAADVKPVANGRWVGELKKLTVNCAVCSNCGALAPTARYCARCGAKMKWDED